jgi:hypothetical protein
LQERSLCQGKSKAARKIGEVNHDRALVAAPLWKAFRPQRDPTWKV